MNATEDPGWRSALRGLLYVPVIPLLLILWGRKVEREPRLILIRTVHVATLGALLLFLRAVASLGVKDEGGIEWWGWVMLGYPVAATTYLRGVTRRKVLAAETIEGAASAYGSGYFILLGLASAGALFGHSLVYIGGGTAAAVVGTGVSYILLWLAAPTRSSLVSLEGGLAEDGKAASLTDQLMKPQPAVG